MGAVQPEQVASLENEGASTLEQRDFTHWEITMTLTLELPLSGIGVWRQPGPQEAAVPLSRQSSHSLDPGTSGSC